jgi:hypothetical protein
MNTISRITIASAFVFFATSAFACNYPSTPKVPNGSSASMEMMVTAVNAVKTYQAALEEYRTCLDTEEKEAIAALDDPGEDELAIRKAAISKKYNASVDDEELLVARFNDEVVAYKAQSK